MIYSYLHKVQYYETDRMGVVHHSNYFRWMEEARVAWLAELGFGYDALEEQGISSPVIQITCSYHRPFSFGSTVCLQVSLAEYNGVRAHIHYQMLDAQSGEPYAEGESLHCFLGNSDRPVNLRRALPAFDAILHPLVAPPEPSQK